MGVYTGYDEDLDRVKTTFDSLIQEMTSLAYDTQRWGYDDMSDEHHKAVRASLIQLMQARNLL